MSARINKIRDHIAPSLNAVPHTAGIASLPTSGAAADDVVICAAVRTPLCKARKGGLRETACDIMVWNTYATNVYRPHSHQPRTYIRSPVFARQLPAKHASRAVVVVIVCVCACVCLCVCVGNRFVVVVVVVVPAAVTSVYAYT